MSASTPRTHLSRRLLCSAAGAAALFGGRIGAAQAAPAAADVAWFKLLPGAAARWGLAPDASDSGRFTLSRTDARPTGSAEKRVLVLFTKASAAFDTAMQSILDVFANKDIPTVFTVANFGGDAARGQSWLDRATADRYDLLFSMGSDTTSFVADRYRGGPVPVVTVCSKDPVIMGLARDYESGSGTNIAYTSLNVPVEVQMAYLTTIMPSLRAITIVSSKNNRSALETQVEPLREAAPQHGLGVFDAQVQVDSLAAEEIAAKLPGALQEAGRLDPGRSNTVIWVPGDTTVFNEIATINRVAQRIPVVSAVPDVVKQGDDSAVLSIGVGFDSNAQMAALYGVSVLTGKAKAGELKVGVVSPPDIAINFRRARAIGLKVPFSFFESAGDVYDYEGRLVRKAGQTVEG